MKRKSIISATAACLLSSGALVAVNVLERNAAESIESDVEVLTVTEGCISYASQINDGSAGPPDSLFIVSMLIGMKQKIA